jgi:hypothetical protein
MLTIVSSFYNEVNGVNSFFLGLRNCLQSHDDVRAILINNGSTDETLRELNSHFKEGYAVNVFDNPTPGGYGQGVNFGVSQSVTSYVLILPSDLQFRFEDVGRLISAARMMSSNFETKHVNIFTKRKRLDGPFASVRGKIWALVVNLFLKIPYKLDPASQLKLLCRCCIPDIASTDFMWDLELSYKMNLGGKIQDVLKVEFRPRITGKSSVTIFPIRTEIVALKKLMNLSKDLRKS